MLAGLAAVALGGAWLVDALHPSDDPLKALPPPVAERARHAEARMRAAEACLARAKLQAGLGDDPAVGHDPSGLIGGELTPLMTTLGNLEAKRVSTNPAWARVLTSRLYRAGIRRGDLIAASFSGSFPALNLALTLAADAIGANVLAVSSVTASTYGANQAGFTWPEIEARLVAAGVIRRASIAVSLGGTGDRGLELEPEGRRLAERILSDSSAALGVPAIRPGGFADAVRRRLELYDRARTGRTIALYVNIGGAEAGMGRSTVVLRLRNGFLPGVPFDFSREQGVMGVMAQRGVPILMLLNIRDLALRWGIAL
jgi:poly-gamma-glutamate system protein